MLVSRPTCKSQEASIPAGKTIPFYRYRLQVEDERWSETNGGGHMMSKGKESPYWSPDQHARLGTHRIQTAN
jgi:hypothetical protein